MSHPFDATLKQIVQESEPDYAVAFGLPDVAFGFGDPIQEVADLNFQSGPDADVVARIQCYGSHYRMKYQVPVRSLLILLRPTADHSKLDGKLTYAAGNTQLQFQCEVMRLWQRPVELFLTHGVGLLPLAPLCQMPPGVSLETALKQVVHEIDEQLSAEADSAKAKMLMTGAYILTGMRIPKWTVDEIFRGVRVMHDSSTFELIEDKAALRQAHRMILRQAKNRFGEPDAATTAALTAIRDFDRLDRIADAVLTATSWQELLATA